MTVVFLGFLLGAKVQLSTAEAVARSIYLEHANLHNGDEFIISKVETITEKGNSLIYIFHLDQKGFIMVPADDQAVPNLAFGFDRSFESSNMPLNLNALMSQYKTELNALIDNPAEPLDEIAEKWNYYLSGNVEPGRDRDVSPLIDAEFDQGGSWNNGIQNAIGFNGPSGCVAIAMCQLMHYWGYPEHGDGSTFYTENDYGYIEVDFEDAFYDFDNMAATYATSASQLLIFHAGVSVNMDYDWSGSGAYVVGGYPSAFYAMENFFGYSSDISYEWKDNHSTNEYRNIIKNELDNNRPTIAQGYGSGYGGGHAWNIDGYSGNNLHCNWGWGGSSNGYYNLTSMGGFPDDQAVIIGLLPQMDAPTALFEYGVNDLTVTFMDLSEIINEVELDSWLWDFGDGSTSFSSAPVHTYAQGGSYDVSLTVTNIYGQESEPHTETVQLGSNIMPGDINGDLLLNILDIVLVVNFILGSDTPDASEFAAADLNSDGILNILDVVTLTNLILGA
jgi:PKD repeat protein